jgi:nitrite reductase/ring-hydroxylating ferredoxin subunit
MSRRILISSVENFPVGELKTINVEGTSILVVRLAGGRFCAVRNRCAHLPLSMSGGKLDGTTLTCPWHSSQYDICTGENLDWVRKLAGVKLPGWSRKLIALGKQPQPLTTYPVIEEDGDLYIEL